MISTFKISSMCKISSSGYNIKQIRNVIGSYGCHNYYNIISSICHLKIHSHHNSFYLSTTLAASF